MGQGSHERVGEALPASRRAVDFPWAASGRSLGVMGVLNVTPDSFYPASRTPSSELTARLAELASAGADVIDIGGESTRPGAEPVPAAEELERVLPAIREVRAGWPEIPVSIDTYKASVAAAALDAGAAIVNDVSGGLLDPAMADLVAEREAVIIVGHLRGTPQTMREVSEYGDVVEEVYAELEERVRAFREAGVSRERIWIDPGIGFAKRAEASRTLLFGLRRFREMEQPIVIGLSRKSFLGEALSEAGIENCGPDTRLEASLAAAVVAAERGAVLIRSHDVAPTRRALAVLEGDWV